MGAAMAPAAAESIFQFLEDTGTCPRGLRRHLHGGPGGGGLRAAVPVFGGQWHRPASGPPGLRPAALRPGAPGCPRGGFRLRVLGLGALRPPAAPHGAGRAAVHPVLRHGGADVPHLLPAGPGHPRRVPRGASSWSPNNKKGLPGGRGFLIRPLAAGPGPTEKLFHHRVHVGAGIPPHCSRFRHWSIPCQVKVGDTPQRAVGPR